MNRIVRILVAVVLLAAVAAGSFYGGMVYGEGRAQAEMPAFPEAARMPGGRGQFGAAPGAQASSDGGSLAAQGGSLLGEIQSIGDGLMTIVDQSGDQVKIYVTDTTLIQKQAEVSLAELEEGETVVISGSRADDGSITARMVQVASALGFNPRGDVPAGGEPALNTDGVNP